MKQLAGHRTNSSTDKAFHDTVASTVLPNPTADVSVPALIHQTHAVDLHAPVKPNNIRTPVPEATVAVLNISTAVADRTPTVSDPSSSPELSTPQNKADMTPIPSSKPLSPSAIGGIAIAITAFICLLIGLAYLLSRRRQKKKALLDAEAATPAAKIAEGLVRSRELRQKPWSTHDTELNKERFERLKDLMIANNLAAQAKKAAAAAETAQAKGSVETKTPPHVPRPQSFRRPSGLAMHPVIPAEVAKMQGEDNIGRAV